ncbi:tetratricopeptide repeat protein [Azospirillum sp. ST 5-10]|uniref:tetratricopeptide repeat protein n=1 Tax=unclassified Azospirillum TaxID=2630922 RepID=UPI003F4A4BB5
MHIPALLGYAHLGAGFHASRSAPYLYASAPHTGAADTRRRLWALEHRYGLAEAPTRAWAASAADARPWFGIADGDPDRFARRCEDALRFAFVANPYRRLLAAHRADIAVDTVAGRRFRLAAVRPMTEPLDFDAFVALLDALPDERRPADLAPQADWLLADGFPYHLVGALERYGADYTAVTARLGAPDDAGPGDPFPGQDGVPCTGATRAAVERLFRRDFELFGYDTDPAAAAEPPQRAADRPACGALHGTPFWSLVEARARLAAGDHAGAVGHVEAVLREGEAGPAGLMPALRVDLARIHLAGGALDEAEAVLRQRPLPGREWAGLLADIRLRRGDADGALAARCQGLCAGAPDAPDLREIGRLSGLLDDLDAALQAGRAVIASAPPGDLRGRLIDALVDGAAASGARQLALAVLDDLVAIEDLGYDARAKLAALGRPQVGPGPGGAPSPPAAPPRHRRPPRLPVTGNRGAGQGPIIALDGAESSFGRAFLVVSALYWCAEALADCRLRFLDVRQRDVGLALDALRWDTGLDVTAQPDGEGLQGAALYAGIAFRSAAHLRLDAAERLGVPTLVAIQFPDPEWVSPAVLSLGDAAFDPEAFGARLVRAVADLPAEGGGAFDRRGVA